MDWVEIVIILLGLSFIGFMTWCNICFERWIDEQREHSKQTRHCCRRPFK